jgi:phenylpropionate dioxygenase-like ring-hydroxylating dioxygenase large terminal subunit
MSCCAACARHLSAPASPHANCPSFPPPGPTARRYVRDVEVDWVALMENSADPGHVHFTHAGGARAAGGRLAPARAGARLARRPADGGRWAEAGGRCREGERPRGITAAAISAAGFIGSRDRAGPISIRLIEEVRPPPFFPGNSRTFFGARHRPPPRFAPVVMALLGPLWWCLVGRGRAPPAA